MATNKDTKRVVIAVDIDGYICEGEFLRGGYLINNCIPRINVIEKVNTLYHKGSVIIYHTSRPSQFYRETHEWLRSNGALFHALVMDKLRADHYLDNRNSNIDDLL